MEILLLVIAGIIIGGLLIAGIYYLNKDKKRKKCTCKTNGKIINNIRRDESIIDGNRRRYITRWYSLCEYTVGETKCVRETNIGTLQPREVGESVTVYYNPNNCHESYIEGDSNLGIKAKVAFILSIILIIFIFFIIKSFS